MATDPLLEQRIDDVLVSAGVHAVPKKMFGGVAFMVNGNMSVGITNKGYLMLRVDPARHEEMVELPGARPMDFTGKVMKGFLFVEHEAVSTKEALTKWITLSLDHVQTLHPKAEKKKAAASKSARKMTGKK